jgi:hypothetical protein
LVFIETRGALKKCSPLHGESASAQKKMGVYSQSRPSFTSVVIARPIAEIDL